MKRSTPLTENTDHDWSKDGDGWWTCSGCDSSEWEPDGEPDVGYACNSLSRSKGLDRTGGLPSISDRRDEKRVARGLDTDLEEWIEDQPCLLSGHPGHTCEGDVVAHHVRAKAHHGDWRITNEADPRIVGNLVPLCSIGGHEGGPQSVHKLGRRTFERTFGVDLEHAARSLGEQFPGEPPIEIQEKAELRRVGT